MEIIVIAALVVGGIYLLFKVFSPAQEIDNAIKAVQAEATPVVVEGAGAVEVAPVHRRRLEQGHARTLSEPEAVDDLDLPSGAGGLARSDQGRGQ